MSFTELGAGIPSRTRANDVIDQIAQDIEDRVMERVRASLAAWKFPTPQVTVQAAPTPNVTVHAPVEIPEPPENHLTCTVEMPGIDQLVRVLNDIKGLLVTPVTKTVTRNSQGAIEKVVERRG